jgi:hypothetical protein
VWRNAENVAMWRGSMARSNWSSEDERNKSNVNAEDFLHNTWKTIRNKMQ